MAIPNRAQADWGQELDIDVSTLSGVPQKIGTFTEAPSIIIIQNDSNVTVSLLRFADSSQTGISFVAGTELVVVGNFKISYIHGKK